MTYQEILEKLETIKVHKKKLKNYLIRHYNDFYQEIINSTNFLDENCLFSERIYCIQNNIHSPIICKHCGKNKVKFRIDYLKYRTYCSNECQKASPETIQKRIDTTHKRYGEHLEKVIQKTRNTRNEKYNGWHPSNMENKTKKTKLERYGDENYNNMEKYRQTCLDKYGTYHHMKSEECKTRYFSQFSETHNGVKYAILLPKSIKKTKDGIRKRSYSFILKNQYCEPCFSLEEYLSFENLQNLPFRCKNCGSIFHSDYDSGIVKCLCDNCYTKGGTSILENDVFEFIKTITDEVAHRNKNLINPLELDITIPKNKLAIEFNGIYWHSDIGGKDKNYHLNKTEKCEERGYQLIHVFENEWVYKQDIVKSRLKNLLGVYDKNIYARKCEIKNVSNIETREFLENNHIQGYCSSKINIGLYFEDKLVSLMTFGKPRFNKKYEYELLRFCNKLNYHIIGGASKLLKFFEKNYKPKSLISYADRRWSIGKLYDKLGFILKEKTKPNYWYFKKGKIILHSRIKFQKYKLKTILNDFDENLSEIENMKNNGYGKIYDCGNMVFEKIY